MIQKKIVNLPQILRLLRIQNCLVQKVARKRKKHSKSLRYTSSESESESESSDSEKRRSRSKSHKKKSKKRFGMAKKSSDKVKFPQVWPHSVLQFAFVSDNVSFLKLDMKICVAGELEISTSKLSRAEYNGRMSLLKKVVYFSNIYEWKCLLQFYAAWLRRIEMGLNSWSDDPTQIIETAMLAGHAAKSLQIKITSPSLTKYGGALRTIKTNVHLSMLIRKPLRAIRAGLNTFVPHVGERTISRCRTPSVPRLALIKFDSTYLNLFLLLLLFRKIVRIILYQKVHH